jgi:hypothetical protein
LCTQSKNTIMKQFFLFTERGMTDRFFCGNIYEALPTDEIRYHGDLRNFADCLEDGICKVFATRKEANTFSSTEQEAMEDSNEYARDAMYAEEK